MLGGREAEAGSASGRAAPENGGGSGRVWKGLRWARLWRGLGRAAREPPGRGRQSRRGCRAPSWCFRVRAENANVSSHTFLGTPSLSFRSRSRSQTPVKWQRLRGHTRFHLRRPERGGRRRRDGACEEPAARWQWRCGCRLRMDVRRVSVSGACGRARRPRTQNAP